MKKLLACILALTIVLGGMFALAEEPAQPQNQYDELVVGTTTALKGEFFTDMWGNGTSDNDVRLLLHGYNLIQFTADTGAYGIDNTVISGIVAADNLDGDRTYTIALYEDMFYSDGTQITAKDYAFSLLLSMAPQVTAINGKTGSHGQIVGAEEYRAGDAKAIKGIRILGDFELSITIKAEYFPFFYEMAMLDCTPYPIHVIAPGCQVADDGEGAYIKNVEGDAAIFTAELLQKTILDPATGYQSHPTVTSGPYKLVSFDKANSTAAFKINEFYKGNSNGEKPSIPSIVYKTVQNETMIEQLRSGEVDLLSKCVAATALTSGMELVAQDAYNASNYARDGYSFISYCVEQSAVQSQAVRQAIALAFDKDAFVNEYVSNYGLRVDGFYGVGQWTYQLVSGVREMPLPAADATAAEIAAYDEDALVWAEMSMDGLTVYNLDLEKAQQLLIADGWTLNADGNEFDGATDKVRCKKIDGELVTLELEMIYPEGNQISTYLQSALVDNLAQIGIVLDVQAKPFTQLLTLYYNQEARDCDMIYLAANFSGVFEPSRAFVVEDGTPGAYNYTNIADQKLYDLTVDMRKTEPGDILAYCQKWVAFQEYWTEALPAIPVYSNVYFDFYTETLQDYNIAVNVNWAQAVVGAYLGDVVTEDVEGAEIVEVTP